MPGSWFYRVSFWGAFDMPSGEDDSDPMMVPARRGEYTARSASRHRSSGATRRLLFFGAASIWGFVAGAAGLLAAMSAAGQTVQPRPGVIAGLFPALAVAIAGGFVMNAAYKESKRRSG
jgi:hypothetical protein